jgi:asparagine synthase (glutamine-hydrolysing)
MLAKMEHRGPAGCQVKTFDAVTIGVCWPAGQPGAGVRLEQAGRAEDVVSDSHYAWAAPDGKTIKLSRDPLGISPLYYGRNAQDQLCFASEVKGLVGVAKSVHEVPPGTELCGEQATSHYKLTERAPIDTPRQEVAAELRQRLEAAVAQRAGRGSPFGAWLSGGLDSSALAAMARKHIHTLHTFAAGFEGAPDLEAARPVARHIRSTHHEVIPTYKEIVEVLPDVIRHLESFDALLVRSSLMNYLVAKLAANYVPAVFSGEGGDELFAGYSYLKKLSLEDLSGDLVDISNLLHNTALQRVDRCSAAHGTVAYVAYLDQDVVSYAVSIPPEYKIVNGLEKWILRRAVMDLLPYQIVQRKKAKFWEGAGVEDRLAAFAESQVTR